MPDPFNLEDKPAAKRVIDLKWAGPCYQWPANVVHDRILDLPFTPWLSRHLRKAVKDGDLSPERCKSLLLDANLFRGGEHILHAEALDSGMPGYALDTLVNVGIAGLKKGLIARQDLLRLLQSPFEGTSVLEAAVLARNESHVKRFLKLMGKLNNTPLNGNPIFATEDIDEVTALSDDVRRGAGTQILGRYQELRRKYLRI